MMKALGWTTIMSMVLNASFALTQETDAPMKASGRPGSRSTANRSLEFARPQLIQDIGNGAMFAGRFDCDTEGDVITLISGYEREDGNGRSEQQLALLGIHPDGKVTNFPWLSVPGFTSVTVPKSIFVGNSRVYVLVDAQSADGKGAYGQRVRLVLTFNLDGNLERATALQDDLNPLAIGVFKSGKIVVASEDRLNHRMALNLVDENGAFLQEIPLGNNDFVLRASQSQAVKYSPLLLISMSKFFSDGDHLVLVPLGTSDIPILELDESSILSSVVPRLPDNMVLESFLSSDRTSFTVRLGTLLQPNKQTVDSEGKILGFGTRPSNNVTELSRADGSIVGQIDTGDQVQPACQSNGAFLLLTGSSQGRLQIVKAHMR